MDFSSVIPALVGAAVPAVAVLYLSWRNKVLSDDVQDWKDYVVDTIDSFSRQVEKKDADE